MAGFSTAVTGLKASTTMLDVAGNNIANSSTVGFKSSRTEFGDIYATAVVGAGSSNTPGSGVTVSDIAQDFSAGTIEFTNNNLDLAINGSGFFQLNDGQGGVTYTRAGAFELDKEGFIVSKNGKFLQGYGLDADGNRLPIGNLAVTQKESPPKATEDINLSFNIDAREDASKLLPTYNKDEPGSFTYTTTVRTFDSLGNEHTVKFNFVEQRPVRNVYEYTAESSPRTVTQTVAGTPTTFNIVNANGVLLAENGGTYYSFDSDTSVVNTGSSVTPSLTPIISPTSTPFILTDPAGPTTYSIVNVDDTSGTGQNGLFAYDSASGIYYTYDSANNTVDSAAPVTFSGAETVTNQTVTTTRNSGDTTVYNLNSITDANGTSVYAESSGVYYSYDQATGIVDASSTYTPVNGTIEPSGELSVSISGRTVRAVEEADGSWSFNEDDLDALKTADPRVDVTTVSYDGANLNFELEAWATDSGDMVVTDGSTPLQRTSDNIADPYRSASEVRVYNITPGVGEISIAGEKIIIGAADSSPSAMVAVISGYEAAILDRNPAIKSVSAVVDGDEIKLSVTYKEEEGDVSPEYNETGDPYPVTVTPESPLSALGLTFNEAESIEGDNSYRGNYRMYAYLNGEELLNLGKKQDPGEGTLTEPGPVLIRFNPTNGLLNSINGETFPVGGNVPALTILGADPANQLTKIDLDLTNSTQFASASIVKSQLQDGYTKGDLIGVTFSGTGEMVASFSNGQNQSLGVVAVATFENQSGLQPSGDTEWAATLDSGDAILNPPGTGLNGTLRSAALEASNVDLSEELVKLIEGQRNFQANSKTLETLNTVTQTILQI